MWEERIGIPGKMLDKDKLIVYFVWSKAKDKIHWILDQNLPVINYVNRFPRIDPEFIDMGGVEVQRAFKYNKDSIFCKSFLHERLNL